MAETADGLRDTGCWRYKPCTQGRTVIRNDELPEVTLCNVMLHSLHSDFNTNAPFC